MGMCTMHDIQVGVKEYEKQMYSFFSSVHNTNKISRKNYGKEKAKNKTKWEDEEKKLRHINMQRVWYEYFGIEENLCNVIIGYKYGGNNRCHKIESKQASTLQYYYLWTYCTSKSI